MKQKTEKNMKPNALSHKKQSGKKLLILAILLIPGFISHAQLQYGIKLNAGGSCQSDLLQLSDNNDIRFSPAASLVAKYNISEGFALKSGLGYQQKGRYYDKKGTELSNKLQYLDIPLLAEFSAGEKAGFKNGQRIFFATGPYLGYLLDAEGKQNGTSFDLKDDTKKFDFGLSFELGMEFPVFNQKALQVALNYDMGLIEVYKTEPDMHNKMASVSVGLLF